MSSIEADGLLRLMNQQHLQNRGDIEELKKGQGALRDDLTSLTSEIAGGVKVLKFIGWMILASIAGIGLWFASLEARGKVAETHPSAVSSTQKAPQVTDSVPNKAY
jgi:hypothetical protein